MSVSLDVARSVPRDFRLNHHVEIETKAVQIMQEIGCGRRYDGERLLCDDERVRCGQPIVCRCREEATVTLFER